MNARCKKLKCTLGNQGDTIVEVLISIAIISTVLGGAFVTTRNSQLGVRNSQEHAIALKLLENQVEEMRSDASGDGNLFTQTGAFCMFNEEPAVPSSGNCRIDSSSNPVPASVQPSFTVAITDCNTVVCPDFVNGSNLFTATATWAQVTGGTANESMVYRLYN